MGNRKEKKMIGYVRGSSHTQKDDLERQIELIKAYAKEKGCSVKRKTHNRAVSRQNWKQIVSLMSYKADVRSLDPRCGGEMKRQKGQVLNANVD